MAFNARIQASIRQQRSMLCVGLDPDPNRQPPELAADGPGLLSFCQAIAEATAAHACAFKPQFAHFAAIGAEAELATLVAWLQQHWPELPVILDAKRGDIGSTAARYAMEAFSRYGADAVTVNPYLGDEAIEPWLDDAARGVVVLCRTSNPGSQLIQHHGSPALFELIASRAATQWNRNRNVMLVCGATHPEDMARVRAQAPDLPFLVPGVGAQGGDLAATVAAGADQAGLGLVISASRSILYAGETTGATTLAAMAAAAAAEAAQLQQRMQAVAPALTTSVAHP